jgi:hypothetical protein
MPSPSAFPDRARVVRKVRTGGKVDGRPVMTEEFGTWFRCRLASEGGTERDSGGATQKVMRPLLYAAPRDTRFAPTRIDADDDIEVVRHGETRRDRYEVDGTPTPSRGRTRTYIIRVSLKAVE